MVDFNTKQRENLAEKGQAMPSGAFPIRNRGDLKRAIQSFGRAKNKVLAKAWIIKRAMELDAVDLLPEKWREPTTELQHYGVMGMKWGKRKSGSSSESSPKESPRWTDDQKKKLRNVAIIGGAVALAAGGAYIAHKSGAFNKIKGPSMKPESVSKGSEFIKNSSNLGKETTAFLRDSSRRVASDNAQFRADALKTLKEVESDQFMLQWMKGKGQYEKLVEAARG